MILTIYREKIRRKVMAKVENRAMNLQQEPELDTKDFLESLWKKNNTPTDKGSKKRKTDKKDDYVPDIKNKRKRFTDV